MAQWGFSALGLMETVRRLHRMQEEYQDPATFHVRAGSGLRYAAFVEYGTGRGPAQPYMRPAAESAAAQAPFYWRMAMQSEKRTSQAFPQLLAEHAAEVARHEVPVDTGDLEDSIEVVRVS